MVLRAEHTGGGRGKEGNGSGNRHRMDISTAFSCSVFLLLPSLPWF